jgi:flagellar biosynthesis chaperone FliJ
MSDSALDSTVRELQEKADRYQEATNFEATLTGYTSDASSAQTSVYGLQSRLNEMERFYAIYSEVFTPEDGPDDPEDVEGIVEDARERARRVLDRTPDDYWELIDGGEIEDYETKIQTAKSEADDVRQTLRDVLNRRQSYWEDRAETGRTVLTLMSDTREAERLLSDIEDFVSDEIWDDSNSINSLQADWQGIQRKLNSGVVADWDEFQKRHDLSSDTVDLLKRLAQGESLSFDDFNRSMVEEVLAVDDLRNALEVTL